MAKYDVTFSCGHEQTVELFGKYADRERKIKFYKEEGLCTECYKNRKREEEAEMPLTLNIGLNVFFNHDAPFELSFGGNSYQVKDDIKELGFRWREIDSGFESIFAMKPNYAWAKNVTFENINEEVKKIKERFPEIVIKRAFTDTDVAAFQHMQEKENENETACQAELAEIEKPEKPACYPTGKWNGKFYGGAKNGYAIYIDGDKTPVSATEKEEIETYQAKMKAYKSKVSEIKQKYNL